MFIYFLMDHIVIWGVFWPVIFFLKIEKKVKRGEGEGEEKVVKNIWVSKDDLWYKVFTEWTRGSEGVL